MPSVSLAGSGLRSAGRNLHQAGRLVDRTASPLPLAERHVRFGVGRTSRAGRCALLSRPRGRHAQVRRDFLGWLFRQDPGRLSGPRGRLVCLVLASPCRQEYPRVGGLSLGLTPAPEGDESRLVVRRAVLRGSGTLWSCSCWCSISMRPEGHRSHMHRRVDAVEYVTDQLEACPSSTANGPEVVVGQANPDLPTLRRSRRNSP